MEMPVVGVFGIRGGGTSAIAGVVKLLGYQMWGEPKTLDDKELLADAPNFEILKQRKGEWAFKHPFLIDYIPQLKAKLPLKPIYVFRDPVASAQHGAGDKLKATAEDWANQEKMLGDKDGLYISYEKAITDREYTVAKIADFINKPINPKAVEWLNPKLGYRNISDYE